MAKYITQLDVSLDKVQEQQLQSQGYMKINVNLNEEAGGNDIYLWYKQGSVPITRVQLTFNDDMAVGLINAGYTKIPKDLNAGAGGSVIYLWYYRGNSVYDAPIVEIDVTTDDENGAKKFSQGCEGLAFGVNRRAQGNWMNLWLKREKQTYICDVTATDSYGSDADNFRDGYIRVDEDTNRGSGGSPVFIWYRQTTKPEGAIRNLNVSTNDSERQALQQQNYIPVNVNLNEGTGGRQVYLWYKKDGVAKPIKGLSLLLNTAAINDLMKAGVTVIERNLNAGNYGSIEYLIINQ